MSHWAREKKSWRRFEKSFDKQHRLGCFVNDFFFDHPELTRKQMRRLSKKFRKQSIFVG